MPIKIGLNQSDRNRIAKWSTGDNQKTIEEIAVILNAQPEHVARVVKQHKRASLLANAPKFDPTAVPEMTKPEPDDEKIGVDDEDVDSDA